MIVYYSSEAEAVAGFRLARSLGVPPEERILRRLPAELERPPGLLPVVVIGTPEERNERIVWLPAGEAVIASKGGSL